MLLTLSKEDINMKKEKMIGAMALAFTVMMIFSSMTVFAAPPQPMTRQGIANLDGVAVGDGMEISAWADGVKYVANNTYYGDGTYKVNVPGNDPDVTTEKDGADDNELVVYWMSDGTNWYIANEVDNFVSASDILGDLNFTSASQPYMAKIWEIVPEPSSGNDFIWIAAPDTWNASAYSIKTDNWTGMSLNGVAQYKSNTAGTWSAWYVDLGGNQRLNFSGDIELVWADPNGNVAGGNAVVIDRVEYGSINTEPANTIMPNAVKVSGAGKALKRAGTVSSPTDTENCSSDFSEVDADYPLLWTAQPVYNLWVEKDTVNGDAILHWDDAGSPPGGYNIYESTDPLAAWPWTALATGVNGTSYTHASAVSDANSHFYIVRATDGSTEGGNSSMAFVAKFDVVNNADKGDINWVSIPDEIFAAARDLNGDGKLSASDIVIDIEGGTGDGTNTKIDQIAYWDANGQTTGAVYSYTEDPFSGNGWGGTDFTITPGMAVSLQATSSFTWVTNGTDSGTNGYDIINNADKGDINWVSVPFTIKDMNGDGKITASDIVLQIEGGTGDGTNTKIDQIAYWDANGQTTGAVYSYTEDPFSGNGWGGTDFTITPGMAVSLQATSSFTWTPELVQDEVTQ